MIDSEPASYCIGELKELDNLMKCGICYEFLNNTLITPCSHNYCSICIRQYMSYKNQCPACFEDIHETQLRNNRVVDEFISIYASIKEKLFKHLVHLPNIKVSSVSSEVNQEPLLEKKTEDFTADHAAKQPVPTSNSNEFGKYGGTPTKNVPTTSKKEVRIPSMFSPKKSKPLNVSEVKVSCPVCSVEIPEKNINIHLDACLKRSQEKRVTHERRKTLPKLVYNLLPDKELRKKLGDLGLNTIGDRKTLINRHKRYTLLYNSECDSLSPKSVPEIIKQMKKEEEDEKKLSTQVVKKLNVDRKADPKVNEEAQRQYLQEHKSSFQRLVEEARRNQKVKNKVKITHDNEPKIITLEESSSETSESEFRIKRPALKRKLITSDSESETNEDGDDAGSTIVTEVNIHCNESHSKEVTENINTSKNKSNKRNEVTLNSWTQNCGPKRSLESPDMSIDEIVTVKSDEIVKDISQEISTKGTRLKKSESDHTLLPSTSFNASVSVTSPVLGTKCRQTRTPTSAHRNIESFKRDLTPDILHEKASAVPSPIIAAAAGQESEEDVVDSDNSSNHSTSLMMYTGPDCDYDLDQSTPTKTPIKHSPTPKTTPISGKNCFDLGIEEILQNTEDFLPAPTRRQSRRVKKSVKITPVRESNGRELRKRVRIDDL